MLKYHKNRQIMLFSTQISIIYQQKHDKHPKKHKKCKNYHEISIISTKTHKTMKFSIKYFKKKRNNYHKIW